MTDQPGELDATPTPTDGSVERAARIGAVYRQLPITLGVTWINALLVAALVAPLVDRRWLLAWVVALGLLVVVRFLGWWRYRRMAPKAGSPRGWEQFSVGGALASGLLWGGFSVLLAPPQEPYAVFMGFVIGGMCAGSATVNSPHPPTVMAFVFPAAFPLAIRFAVQGTRLDAAMAAMTAVFAVALVLSAARFSRFFDASVRTRVDLANRTAALARANTRLRAEIAEHHATEAALRHSQKMEAVGRLTAGVAHDMNNLLMAISGSAELLQRRLTGVPDSAPLLAAIFRATDRGARLTRHLLAFARQEVLDPTVVDVNALLTNLTTLLEATLGKSIRIRLRLAPSLWPVLVDRNEIERAILNLAINARDAMPTGGDLTIATENAILPDVGAEEDALAGSCAVVSVTDTGSGMPDHVRQRAFDPFFTTKPVGQGSGLGLSQVYGLLKQLGGATRIESVEGQGTTVRLILPRATEADLAAQRQKLAARKATRPAVVRTPPPPPDDHSAPPHVVVLDDEAPVADVVAQMLRTAGYRVSCFTSVAPALGCLAADASVAALVTDLGMPERRGDEVAQAVRSGRPDLPVVFITGYNDAVTLVGEPWQLRKPFAATELVGVLERALATDVTTPL